VFFAENKAITMPGFDLIKSVVLSWQVIAVTFAFIIYWSIVSAIVRPRRKKAVVQKSPKTMKRPAEQKEFDKNIDTSNLGLE
jgi:predicted membrane protein